MLEDVAQLRALYPQPTERAVRKMLPHIDVHAARFISLSPFFVLASTNSRGEVDASPRGGLAGFVRVQSERTLLIPDSPGNNRLDSLVNIIETRGVGMIFMIPGVGETLRVNGNARLRDEPEILELFRDDKRAPRIVTEVTVNQALLHCAKAFMRSKLWEASSLVDRKTLPTLGEMIKEQTGIPGPAETEEQMLARYAPDL